MARDPVGGADIVSGNGLTVAVRARILDLYKGRLAELNSPIVGNPVWLDQVMHQADAVLEDVFVADLSRPTDGFDRPDLGRDRLSVEIGGTRAMSGIHPGESLYAATVLFAIILGELAREAADTRHVVALSEVLHGSIMRRIGVAAISYASFLLSKVHRSHLEERQRMARELHDRAAHEVGVSLQNLELYGIYLADKPERAAVKLETARHALREALYTVRALSAELGRAVGTDGLIAALDRYLTANVPPGVEVRFSSTGDDRSVPGIYSEEVYLVLREAVRNALVHGDPGSIEVTLACDNGDLRAVVRDNGDGFDVEAAHRERAGIGLTSMRERMDLLGGSLTVTSCRGKGTIVEARVDLPDAVR